MKKFIPISIVVIVIVVIGALWYVSTKDAPTTQTSVADETYTNSAKHFSFSTPMGYEIHESDGVITVENSKGDGIQILITPADEDIPVMTEERIKADIPDMTITDTEPVEIGDSRKGLAFKSNNEAFDGASREVWFVFGGNLYQISTYERLDPVLKALFNSWKFL